MNYSERLAIGLESTDMDAGKPRFPPDNSGILIAAVGDPRALRQLVDLTEFFFPLSADVYCKMDADDYRALVARAQEEINNRKIGCRLARSCYSILRTVLQTDRVLIQSNVYLRATRPNMQKGQEHIGWHRESFYGPDMQACANFWVPISGVSTESALKYIPDSHTIPDEKIKTVHENSPDVMRFSAGHKIGLLYAPKRLVEGVDLSNPREMIVLPGEAAIFPGALIHGAGENRSDRIRFSLDCRLIAHENYQANKLHFASGKPYFEPL